MLGWATQSTVLGTKQEECAACGHVVEHALVRRGTWFFLVYLPVLPLRIRRGMVCTNCRAWTGIGWRTMRRALKTGALPLQRSRPQFEATLARPDPITGARRDAAEYFDRVTVNPKRGRWDLYTKAWPGLAVAFVLVFGVAVPAMRDQLRGDVRDLRVGDCFEVPRGETLLATGDNPEVEDVQHRPCTSPHDGEVFHVAKMPKEGSYPTNDELDEFVGRECVERQFEAYVGTAYEEAYSISIGYFYPTAKGWSRGDRDVTCYATPDGGITVDHSYRAAGK